MNLSDRIRPNCEAAPWVVEEVKKLERENAALRASHWEIYAALGTNEADHAKWPQQIAALRADKERLDWLAISDKWFDVPATESFTPDTFRAAIDAARKEQP